jgi:hypothetical protein
MNHSPHDPTLIFAFFQSEKSFPPLLDQLRQAGIRDDRMEIVSPLPIEPPLLHRRPRIPLYVIAILTGIAGIGFGIALAGGTAILYPIPTGGKPHVAPPVIGIIAFETMMLAAIVCTFLTMAGRIMFAYPFSGLRHDSRIDGGLIGLAIRVESTHTAVSGIHDLLYQSGAVDVEEWDTPQGPATVRERES